MDQALNIVVAFALAFVAVTLTLLVAQALPLLRQLSDTAHSCQSLLTTLEKEVQPTAAELRDLLHGVNQIRAITASQVTEVSTKVEDLTGNVNQMVGSAKKESSVMGAGLLAGLRAYFQGDESVQKDLGKTKDSQSQRKKER